MQKNTFRNALTAATMIGLTALAGCSENAQSTGTPSTMPTQSRSAGSSPTADSSGPSSKHNAQDVMFAQMMIPHHQQAVQMSNLILTKNGNDPRVIKLARRIKAAQAPEITTMRGWLTGWGANPSPVAMDHHGMGHGSDDGMMSKAEMKKLKKADGNQADRLFLSGMTAHHKGAIAMAKDETSRGQNPAAQKMAASITTSQQAEIDTMKRLLTDL